jgi:metallo-beta-lactamase family protein
LKDISIEFVGAAGEVTGSRSILRVNNQQFLIDCGLFQGPKATRQQNWEPLLGEPSRYDAIILTHAHLDHSGYLPRFYKEGYRGPIHCSHGTKDLAALLLKDAAHLEEEFARYANETGYSNHRPAKPLFTEKDVENVLPLFQGHPRHTWIALSPEVSIRFLNAGHIIGASMVQFSIATDHKSKLITFSGDLGHERSFTLRGPEYLLETDILVLESTYGDRRHPRSDTLEDVAEICRRTFQRRGVLVIPAFSVGRTQEVLYILRKLEDEQRIPKVPVILDSPMAMAATRVHINYPEDHREELRSDDFQNGLLPELFETTPSPNDSMLACMRDGPMVVISAAGMLNGGRILHHLKARLPHAANTVLFCGYQAEGTKGRFLQDNAGVIDSLRIHHQEVPIAAEIATIQTLSAHGDCEDLTEWLSHLQRPCEEIFLNHGSVSAMQEMAEHLTRCHPSTVIVPVAKPQKFEL